MKLKYILVIILVGFVAYFNMPGNSFVWDDEEQIVKNVIIQNFSNFSRIL